MGSGSLRNAEDPRKAAKAAIAYIESGHHVGISEEQYKNDLARQGKDHDATMKYLLGQIVEGKSLPPAFVAKYSGCPNKFQDKEIEKVILDGTHRASASAFSGEHLRVFEFDMDRIVKIKTKIKARSAPLVLN